MNFLLRGVKLFFFPKDSLLSSVLFGYDVPQAIFHSAGFGTLDSPASFFVYVLVRLHPPFLLPRLTNGLTFGQSYV